MKERYPALGPRLPLSGVFHLGQHDQRTRQFIGGERVGSGRNDQLAKLLHFAVLQVFGLVLQRLQFRIKVSWFSHHRLHKQSMER